MSDPACRDCVLSPGLTVCRRCLVNTLRKGGTTAARWAGSLWAVALGVAMAGLHATWGRFTFVGWVLAVTTVLVGGLLGAVLYDQKRAHPRPARRV